MATATDPQMVAVLAQLGAHRRVYVLEGTFHQHTGNVNAPDRNGRSRVVGRQMRCGLAEPLPASWAHDGIHPSLAQVPPCPTCFGEVHA